MRVVCALLLCLTTVAAQGKANGGNKRGKRTAADLLADYAQTLGDVSQVRALHATGSIGAQQGMSVYYKDGNAVRTVRGRTEYVGKAGVFISWASFFERYRDALPSQFGMAYAQRMLATPFPLLAYVNNAKAAAGLKLGVAVLPRKKQRYQFEVLATEADAYGVSTEYMFDRKTHVLTVIRFLHDGKTVASLWYADHKRVDGVLLPGAVELYTLFQYESDEDKAKLVSAPGIRVDHYLKWTINPDLKGVSFEVPGVSAKNAKGFQRVELATGPEPHESAIGDLDGDGKNDVAVACLGGVWVHFGGALRKPVKVPLGKWNHRGLVIEDLNRDGRPEIVTMSRMLPAEMFYIVSFDKQRKPDIQKFLGAPFLSNALVCADLDLDGLGDLVSTGWGDRVLDFKFGNGQRGFRVRGIRWPLANKKNMRPRGYGVAVGLINADHQPDVVIADGTRVRVYTGRLSGALIPVPPLPAGPRPVDVCLADVNADGKADVIVANDASGFQPDLKGDVAVLLNTGKGLKFHGKPIEGGVRVLCVRAGHFDADAHIDIATTSYLTGEVRILLGDGKGGFREGGRLRSGRGTHRVHVADFDSDGKDDILASNRLDDTITILMNRTGAAARPALRPRRARECKAVPMQFRMKGLTTTYDFMREFRIPSDIRDPSGIAFLGGDDAHRQLVIVSDKEPSLLRVVLDVRGKRLLVGPRIPLVGVNRMGARLDLEAAAFDGTGNLFLACEADSSILRVSLLGHLLNRVVTGIKRGNNDGIEALAIRRKKDGTPLLYVFKERMGKTGAQPPVHVYGIREQPFALPLELETKIPFATIDQTGATVVGQRMFVLSRLARTILEFGFDGRGFSAENMKRASFGRLTRRLGLEDLFGVAEGLAIDTWGDLYILIDNNRKVMGKPGLNRGDEGRLLWFRAVDKPKQPLSPREVVIKQIYIPWQGAMGNPRTKLTRRQAGDLADKLGRKLRTGADFDAIAKEHHHKQSPYPALMTIKTPPTELARGEFNRSKLPTAFARLAFALEVGEVGVAEWHREESPYGFHILIRIK